MNVTELPHKLTRKISLPAHSYTFKMWSICSSYGHSLSIRGLSMIEICVQLDNPLEMSESWADVNLLLQIVYREKKKENRCVTILLSSTSTYKQAVFNTH